MINPQEVKIPIKNSETGETEYEAWNVDGKQSDGSMWSIPRPMTQEGHEHFLKLDPHTRFAECECGVGGFIFPHNAQYKNGHVYDMDDKLVL